ncbi:phosphotransferase [Asanoa sp. WMMD1127]|uniref:phosphotransferase n=1 Tax=Asanoa sp. WMMD1127 TaxID=3016107 RepID=UPI002416E71B|nr:phosphotransferase [Asanoa sp. WMMD1127]MDG4823065.1 phosphotransferase [Asanoa sp. WMMD1127]
MRDRPAALDERDLIAALESGWNLRIRAIRYLPVGAGSYHWSVDTHDGQTWFATVDDQGLDDDAFDLLDRALTTTTTLSQVAALDFVVAPLTATNGQPTRRITPRYALSVYPMIDAAPVGQFGRHAPSDLPAVVDMVAKLHLATATVTDVAPRADTAIPGRDRLEQAMAETDRAWHSGPYAEPARHLLAAHADHVRARLTDFDRRTAQAGATLVITHGEPHPGNILRTATGLRLVDWDTTRLAPPERDLWMLLDEKEPERDLLARYTNATGLTVDPTTLALYRRRWALADIAAFVDDLRRPHGDSEDPAAALHHLGSYLDAAT